MERVEAFFRGPAYRPHRHDTYAVGFTVSGVQGFDYRGEARHCVPGQIFVLHPDELHDGRSGGEEGFGYRILYLAPELVQEALGHATLPFVRDPVSDDPRLRAATHDALADIDHPLDGLRANDIALAIGAALKAASGAPPKRRAVDRPALRRARALLAANAVRGVASHELESETGLDRWTLARQFRAAYGVGPHRFMTMRRLERARALIGAGVGLAEAAQEAGFADQSHMTRQFRNAYGLSPGRWRELVSHGSAAAA